MFDLTNLTPMPWYEDLLLFIGVNEQGCGRGGILLEGMEGEYTAEEVDANTKFIVLARSAFDVMMRRGWHPVPLNYEGEPLTLGWIVCSREGPDSEERCPNVAARFKMPFQQWPDPFTALVEADKWMAEQEKGATHDPQTNG